MKHTLAYASGAQGPCAACGAISRQVDRYCSSCGVARHDHVCGIDQNTTISSGTGNKSRAAWSERVFGIPRLTFRIGTAVIAVLGIGGLYALTYGQDAAAPSNEAKSQAASQAPTAFADQTGLTNQTPLSASGLSKVCRAGIAHIMGRDPALMKARSMREGTVRVSYRRPSDGTLWKDDCRVDGSRIIWRTVDAFPGDGPGVWRLRSTDETVTYNIDSDRVTIDMANPDGSHVTATYVMGQ